MEHDVHVECWLKAARRRRAARCTRGVVFASRIFFFQAGDDALYTVFTLQVQVATVIE